MSMTLLDDLKIQRICAAVREGSSYVTACQLAGIELRTLQEWKRWGKEGKEPYRRFYLRLRESEACCAEDMIAHVRKAAAKDWKAAAWWLERRMPEIWGAPKDRPEKPLEKWDDAEIRTALESALQKMKAANE